MARIPLAFLELTHNKGRLLTSVAGVAFAAVLMFLEMGFLNGMFDSQTYPVKVLNADLFLISKQKESVAPLFPFPKSRLQQAKMVEGVEAAYPIYMEDFRSTWKDYHKKKEHVILVWAFDPSDPVFLLPEVIEKLPELQRPYTALIDEKGKDLYGDKVAGAEGELSRNAVQLVGTFSIGPDFRIDGNLITSDRTFFKCFADPRQPENAASRVEFGLIKVKPGYDPRAVSAALNQALPDDVRVLTKQELIDQIISFWASSQPVGYVFGMGMFVGFIIGVTICYQVLYTDIMDHLPQYATLKAIGYSDGFLKKVVLQEAVILAVLGYFPGLLISRAAYGFIETASGIQMRLNFGRCLLVLVLTVIMCAVSGLIAVRKVIRSDPTEVF
jgi:putative ABC transport system permease protein